MCVHTPGGWKCVADGDIMQDTDMTYFMTHKVFTVKPQYLHRIGPFLEN